MAHRVLGLLACTFALTSCVVTYEGFPDVKDPAELPPKPALDKCYVEIPPGIGEYPEQVEESGQTSYYKCTSTKSEKVYLVPRLVVFDNELVALPHVLGDSHSES